MRKVREKRQKTARKQKIDKERGRWRKRKNMRRGKKESRK